MPLGWKPHKRAQKDVDAKWTKKHGKNHFGYKLHASVDKRCKLIRKIAVTHAAVADTNVFEELLDLNNTSRDVYADRGYPSLERETGLKQAGWRVHIQRRGHAPRAFRTRRSDAIARSPRRALVSNMCLGPWRRWAANWCVAWGSCARRSPCT
jgi:IS5 family transposase